jgi:hypothetical protein
MVAWLHCMDWRGDVIADVIDNKQEISHFSMNPFPTSKAVIDQLGSVMSAGIEKV